MSEPDWKQLEEGLVHCEAAHILAKTLNEDGDANAKQNKVIEVQRIYDLAKGNFTGILMDRDPEPDDDENKMFLEIWRTELKLFVKQTTEALANYTQKGGFTAEEVEAVRTYVQRKYLTLSLETELEKLDSDNEDEEEKKDNLKEELEKSKTAEQKALQVLKKTQRMKQYHERLKEMSSPKRKNTDEPSDTSAMAKFPRKDQRVSSVSAIIEAKYMPSFKCTGCNQKHFKADFSPNQWNSDERARVCKSCEKIYSEDGTKKQCKDCGWWCQKEKFDPEIWRKSNSTYVVCKMCNPEEKKQCNGPCEKMLPRRAFPSMHAFRHAGRRNDDKGKCISCAERHRELKICSVCKEEFPENLAYFSKRMWQRLNDDARKCNRCVSCEHISRKGHPPTRSAETGSPPTIAEMDLRVLMLECRVQEHCF